MPIDGKIFQVMIASPSDVKEERDIAREIINEWNSINSKRTKIFLLPLGWEKEVAPQIGQPAQEIINKELLNDCDLLVGIFWTRIGTPTKEYASGSVEEIQKHIGTKKPAMIYFSSKPVHPDSIDSEQYENLKKFKEYCKSLGIIEHFDDTYKFKENFRRHLSLIINSHEFFNQYIERSEKIFEDVDRGGILVVPNLSERAIRIILETYYDHNGQLMFVVYMDGFQISANNKVLNEDSTARTKAVWKSAVKELLDYEILSPIGYKGEIFELTHTGFRIAEHLLSRKNK